MLADDVELPPPYVDYESDCALPLIESDGSDGQNAISYVDGERYGRGNPADQVDVDSITGVKVFKCADLVAEPSLLGIIIVTTSNGKDP